MTLAGIRSALQTALNGALIAECTSDDTGGFAIWEAPADRRAGNSFTPTLSRYLGSIEISAQIGTLSTECSGNITVELFATDGDGYPTGAVLSTGTLNAAEIIATKAWHEVFMSSYLLVAGTKYVFIVKYPGSTETTYSILLRYTPVSYSGGYYTRTVDGGATWMVNTAFNFPFKAHAPKIIRTYDTAPIQPVDNAFAYILPKPAKRIALGAYEYPFDVIVMVQRLPEIDQAQNNLDAFLDSSGVLSIWNALENADLGAHGSVCRVLGYSDYSGMSYNGNVYLGVKFAIIVN